MSVGKESIKRAASAGARKSTPENQVKEAPDMPAAEVAAEAAKPVKKTTARKTTAAKPAARKTTARKTTAKTTKAVKTSVLTPANAEEIQTKFISDKAKQPENPAAPVHINEELPVYLL